MKWVVDPGLDGDVYADKPYLYGPAASSVNRLFVGPKTGGEGLKEEEGGGEGIGYHEAGLVFEEGGDEEGMDVRMEKGVPETEAARKKHFLVEEKRKEWEWEEGRVYGCDFYNPYLDFNGEFVVCICDSCYTSMSLFCWFFGLVLLVAMLCYETCRPAVWSV